MKVLAIDTSNYTMGVALLDGNTVIGEIITNLKKNHSVRLMPAVEQIMKECGVKPNELEKIVVASGPGSYTGVRIGVTAAKTMAWALNIPIAGVSSLEVLAANGSYFSGCICPLFDARRQQIYTGLYTYEHEKLKNVKEDRIILIEEWLNQLKGRDEQILFVGNDVSIHKEMIREMLGEQAVFCTVSQYNPRPSELALLGLEKEAQPVHAFVPNYIRLAEAEANWLANQKQ
jgi:tRNA threonylcarbamoyladenosine biosynthesis protein TsaB